MTVNELILELTSLLEADESLGECPIHFQYNYGDFWRTQVAPEVDSVAEGLTAWSDYHSMPKVHDEEAKEKKEITRVVLLNGL